MGGGFRGHEGAEWWEKLRGREAVGNLVRVGKNGLARHAAIYGAVAGWLQWLLPPPWIMAEGPGGGLRGG